MRRAPLLSCFLCLSLLAAGQLLAPAVAASGVPEAAAPEEATPSSAPDTEGREAASPWEHPLWHDSTAIMRLYLCDHARRPPSWCAAPHPLPGKVELPAVQGPPLHEEDARWLAFLEKLDPANLSQEDVALIRQRAAERRDPQAMEILGYLYAEGRGVERDYAESYRWYGRAYLAGETRVRANMDVVWELLQRHDLAGAMELVREFDARTGGTGLPGLTEAPQEAPKAASSAAR